VQTRQGPLPRPPRGHIRDVLSRESSQGDFYPLHDTPIPPSTPRFVQRVTVRVLALRRRMLSRVSNCTGNAASRTAYVCTDKCFELVQERDWSITWSCRQVALGAAMPDPNRRRGLRVTGFHFSLILITCESRVTWNFHFWIFATARARMVHSSPVPV
jgi:hypothetical protein